VFVRVGFLKVHEVCACRLQQPVDVEHVNPGPGLLDSEAHLDQCRAQEIGEADTPCERLLESGHISSKAKARLRAQRASLNPFELHQHLELVFPRKNGQVPRSGMVVSLGMGFGFGSIG
jgi:hypothetical protein